MNINFTHKLESLINKLANEFQAKTREYIQQMLRADIDSPAKMVAALQNSQTAPEIRQTIAWLLTRIQAKGRIEALLGCLHDEDMDVQRQVIISLGLLEVKRA